MFGRLSAIFSGSSSSSSSNSKQKNRDSGRVRVLGAGDTLRSTEPTGCGAVYLVARVTRKCSHQLDLARVRVSDLLTESYSNHYRGEALLRATQKEKP